MSGPEFLLCHEIIFMLYIDVGCAQGEDHYTESILQIID
jgi:hypothetical protein